MKPCAFGFTAFVVIAASLMGGCASSSNTNLKTGRTNNMHPLSFDVSRYELQQVTVAGESYVVRAFEGIAYVSKPIDLSYQILNFYVPEAYFQGGEINGFTAKTAPIFFPNYIGGYMPAKPGTARPALQGPNAGKESTIAVALSKGFVVASAGARGRSLKDAQGAFSGKAPAAIVDLKAAVRYLRQNDAVMPGDAEKIISNGTSAGGAFSALLGASGNAPDYRPYLAALGAAEQRDDIFAVSAYCPIINLENADAAYEWQFGGVNDYRKIEVGMLDFNMVRKEVAGTLNAEQMALSAQLKPVFSTYLNSLQLRSTQGQLLTLDADGNGSFKDWVKHYVMKSAQVALNAGQDMHQYNWLTVHAGAVQDLNYDAFVRYSGRLKLPPAFDALDLSNGENDLFGTSLRGAQHFTAFAAQHSLVPDAGLADTKVIQMMDPMHYIGAPDARTAGLWRVRHGTLDRDTSLAIPTVLATTLQNKGYNVDFALPWDVPHSGDYDLDALFQWARTVAMEKTEH
ncbi:MAG: alpha/beta hydrolase [Curvibacter sp.]|nr:MAG: alpha/beta hydrolase [Curvibacter sp.]